MRILTTSFALSRSREDTVVVEMSTMHTLARVSLDDRGGLSVLVLRNGDKQHEYYLGVEGPGEVKEFLMEKERKDGAHPAGRVE